VRFGNSASLQLGSLRSSVAWALVMTTTSLPVSAPLTQAGCSLNGRLSRDASTKPEPPTSEPTRRPASVVVLVHLRTVLSPPPPQRACRDCRASTFSRRSAIWNDALQRAGAALRLRPRREALRRGDSMLCCSAALSIGSPRGRCRDDPTTSSERQALRQSRRRRGRLHRFADAREGGRPPQVRAGPT
jgi:hypothetical protein